MASETQVKQYLAYWFQLGKKLVVEKSGETLLPEPIFHGDRYSQAFNDCWELCVSPDSGDCYLEGTQQTVRQLLEPQWDIDPCARCQMPVPILLHGTPSCATCPCHDLSFWPNDELPKPRLQVNTQVSLREICRRIVETGDGRSSSSHSRSNLNS
ncbi:hypothetical protein AY599_19835 [Leptolyngbya valderiana BDU 20041]|nr:hypothetical protein [Geitlerinema sp. CS-897]OAB55070.1 hypothetical protein AY599_19835 [Leptolyngbya valderiana BDU 20041]PPT10297.1 hypothetical protein CKA32_002938 [Geitlerinema sp. FC II]